MVVVEVAWCHIVRVSEAIISAPKRVILGCTGARDCRVELVELSFAPVGADGDCREGPSVDEEY